MKSLKVLAFTASLALLFAACKKDKDVVSLFSKDQMAGKWITGMVVNNISQEVQLNLNNNGVSELDVQPYGGNAEFTGTWELSGANIIVHFTYSGNPDYIRFDGPVNSANSIAGKLLVGGQTGTFTMTK
ncbi:MAG: hypothetical protein ABJB11_14585 [Ferruginibacter sp.]